MAVIAREAGHPTQTSVSTSAVAKGRGAARATFVPTTAQRGKALTVKVTARRTGHYSGVAWTRATVAVAS
ncbi:glycoside hydrolase Chb [Streptomyces sp. NPDC020807]|uniref:glycoside hydrolase Chb n=1 Tax=Streptomyces sp. NPDC020807 TaxID=3155119 RepID=UPI0033C3999A